jgi:hypothetical protein
MGLISFWEMKRGGVLLEIFVVRRTAVPYWEMMKFACNGADLQFPVYEQALSKGVPVWHSK